MLKIIMMRIAAIAAVCSLSFAVHARAENPQRFEVPAGELIAALETLARQSGIEFVYQTEQLKGVRTSGVTGVYTPENAVTILLKGTNLAVKTDSSGAMLIAPPRANSSPRSTPTSGTQSLAEDGSVRIAQVNESRLLEGEAPAKAGGVASDTREQLDEIMVTATKREERLQDIPASIAVIGRQDIERRSVVGMEDYLRSVPGVNEIDNGPLSNAIIIRGISTSPEFENFNSGTTVATFFDETPITAAAGFGAGGIDLRPVDFERIEILRGPQGTAFGSASLGGAVRMIPAKPSLDGFGAKIAGNYSDTSGSGTDNSMIQGILNIPVVKDTFAIRAVGYRYDESGYYRNIAGVDPATIAIAETYGLGDFVRGPIQDHVGGVVSTGGRIAALWRPSENLDLSFNYLTQKIEQDGLPVTTVGDFDQTRMPIAPQVRMRGESGDVNDTNIDLANVVLNYDFSWAKLTSSASWIDSGSDQVLDVSIFFAQPISSPAVSDFKSFTAETRLASHLDGRFQFLAGVYYEDIDEGFLQTDDWDGALGTNPIGTDPMFYLDSQRETKQKAVFGELTYAITDKVSATVGGRYFEYDKDGTSLTEGGFAGVPIGEGTPVVVQSSEDDSSFKANLSYKPTPDSLLYASWAQGFRLGQATPGLTPFASACDIDGDGVVDGTDISIESTTTVNSDFLDNYEIGGKFSALDRRLVIDASVYHIDWTGLPIRSVVTCGDAQPAYTANVGGATSDGAEVQASILMTEGLRLDLGGSYTKAELSKDAPGLYVPAFKGDRLPGSPKVSANLSIQYDFDFGGNSAFVRADSYYAGKFYGNLQETESSAAGDYVKVDARAGILLNKFSIELFVRNLTDEDAYTWQGFSGGYRLRPRTVGMELGYRFE